MKAVYESTDLNAALQRYAQTMEDLKLKVVEVKICCKCGETKPIREFYAIKSTKRRRPECRSCAVQMTKEWKHKNVYATGVHSKRGNHGRII